MCLAPGMVARRGFGIDIGGGNTQPEPAITTPRRIHLEGGSGGGSSLGTAPWAAISSSVLAFRCEHVGHAHIAHADAIGIQVREAG